MSKTFLDKNNNTLATVYETSEVVANPTLEGTEASLTGLKIGSTKYAVSGGSSTPKYKHEITAVFVSGCDESVTYYLTYIDNNNVEITTLSQLKNFIFLKNIGGTRHIVAKEPCTQYLATGNTGLGEEGQIIPCCLVYDDHDDTFNDTLGFGAIYYTSPLTLQSINDHVVEQ